MTGVETAEEARRVVAYWAEEGATWLKFYTRINREAARAAIEEAHSRGMRVTGHLCSLSYTEAVQLGIDNIEHGSSSTPTGIRRRSRIAARRGH